MEQTETAATPIDTSNDFKYSVAFSFLAQDEALATELNDLVQERMATFLYSERQREIAGSDGEETFGRVFREQARIVVVLCRHGWGQTPWTRIEETAIRGRAYDEGYDFALFIPLDDPPTVPKWLPKTRIWVGLKRWGAQGAAAVIEARVQELGGNVRQESIIDRAARLQRATEFAERQRAFRHSYEGVKALKSAYDDFRSAIAEQAATIKAASLPVEVTNHHEFTIVHGMEGVGVIQLRTRFANSLDEHRLLVEVHDSMPPLPGLRSYFFTDDRPRKLVSEEYSFDMLAPGQTGWRLKQKDRDFQNASGLADHVLQLYMDYSVQLARSK